MNRSYYINNIFVHIILIQILASQSIRLDAGNNRRIENIAGANSRDNYIKTNLQDVVIRVWHIMIVQYTRSFAKQSSENHNIYYLATVGEYVSALSQEG